MCLHEAFDLDAYDGLQVAFDCLPPKSFSSGVLVYYENLKFRSAPVWKAVAPYRHTLLQILKITGNLNITQLAGTAAMRLFVQDMNLKYYVMWPVEPERAIYRLRCMLSQLAWHIDRKQKKRKQPIPKKWYSKFAPIYEQLMLSVEADFHTQPMALYYNFVR